GVRVVVDSGFARVPAYDPATGLAALETRRVSRASADQRRGRAGRTEPGVCYRLWNEAQTASFAAYDRPEILTADLSGFALDLARSEEHTSELQSRENLVCCLLPVKIKHCNND